MKILHVIPAYLPAYRYGGPIQTVHALNKYLVRAGAEVTVYTTAIDGAQDLDVSHSTAMALVPVDRDGVKVYYFKPGWPRSWFYSPDMRRALKEHARDFDIIHITSVFLAASTLGARAARAAGKPYIISPRGSLMLAPLEKKSPLKKRIYINMIERANLADAVAIHFTTDMEQREYEAAHLPLNKAIVIPNGLDPESLPPGDPKDFLEKFKIAPEKKIVLSLGRISWKKGFDALIPAFANVAREIPEAILVIAGGDDEGYMPKLNKLIDDNHIRGKVVFTGQLEGAMRTAALKAGWVFVMPSYAENFGITAVESVASGTMAVVSSEVGAAHLIKEAGVGSVVDKGSIESLTVELKSFLQDKKREIGEANIKNFVAALSYEKIAKEFITAYESILTAGRS